MRSTPRARSTIAVVLSALALVVALIGDPAAAARAVQTTVVWPTGPVQLGAVATVDVTVTGLTPGRTRRVELLAEGPREPVTVGQASVDAEDPAVSLPIPTSVQGTTSYVLRVGRVTDRHTVTVAGSVTTLTGRIPAGTYDTGEVTDPVTGTVTGTPGRTVRIEARAEDGTWVPLSETAARPDGTYTLRIPTFWSGVHTLRIAAPPTDTDQAGVAAREARVRIQRTYRPRPGSSHDVAPVGRWDPCVVHPYLVNPDHAWRGHRADVRSAFDAISAATGLRFRYAGSTTYIPWSRGSRPHYPDDVDFVVAWTTPAVVPELAGSIVGLGGYLGADSTGKEELENYGGGVALDATWRTDEELRISAHEMRRWLLLHELGHTVGLNHVSDPRQLMFPFIVDQPAQYARGDLAGLATIGADRGCIDAVDDETHVSGTTVRSRPLP